MDDTAYSDLAVLSRARQELQELAETALDDETEQDLEEELEDER